MSFSWFHASYTPSLVQRQPKQLVNWPTVPNLLLLYSVQLHQSDNLVTSSRKCVRGRENPHKKNSINSFQWTYDELTSIRRLSLFQQKTSPCNVKIGVPFAFTLLSLLSRKPLPLKCQNWCPLCVYSTSSWPLGEIENWEVSESGRAQKESSAKPFLNLFWLLGWPAWNSLKMCYSRWKTSAS